jgi:hypothetical protein
MSKYENYELIIEKFLKGEVLTFMELLSYSRRGIYESLEYASNGDFERIINQTAFVSELRLAIQGGDFDEEFEKDVVKNQILIKSIITLLENEILDLYQYNEIIEVKDIDLENQDFFETIKSDLLDECNLLINHLGHFVPEFHFENKLKPKELNELEEKTENEKDTRRSAKAPTNASRIKALKELCPDLWSKLVKSQSKEVRQNVIHAITGVNKEDSYKYSFGSRQSEMNNRIIEGLDLLKTELK